MRLRFPRKPVPKDCPNRKIEILKKYYCKSRMIRGIIFEVEKRGKAKSLKINKLYVFAFSLNPLAINIQQPTKVRIF